MPVFVLTEECVFPSPELARGDGLLAIGGDLSMDRLLVAYRQGIFPWYGPDSPILWWAPDPRIVLIPQDINISRSLRQTIKKGLFKVTTDRAFRQVITNCSMNRKIDGGDTWLTKEMIEAYVKLHEAGFAHSIESWHDGELAGGLYGVVMGGVFFGESMFFKKSNASKVAFATIVQKLIEWGFVLIDCQVATSYLMSFGATHMPRKDFMRMIKSAIRIKTSYESWKYDEYI
ncbi:leucyl/phenylalanyl-tRNA--protein transferase [Candidatus Magnetobacterium bavaricum]|uniref:Leucyl/phenylalanyl-tRNA--protein transferase n=1 Tax=Candidatus Magnetobacterium bavaricum TaxID=29290 RepID=A0A0F3GPR7_9BACT|nr:leucyl/phenylalanyl-tRNA--protein transferase [Candidatus Magnetobacterium bavaricum]